MQCYLCESKNYIEILHKPSISIWTNSSNDDLANKKKKYKCLLYQCNECASIYQPADLELGNALKELYTSNYAQLSTTMGDGNWGIERANFFFELFFNIIGTDIQNYKSVIEIGCANGYLLRHLKNFGFKDLVGIDPSINKTEELDGILFLKEFANEKLKLSKKYDLIFSVGVFEHIEEINNVIKFCKNTLSKNGELFICVPDAKRQLEDGDPALFSHQHIHYYTQNSLEYLLAKHGFRIKSMISKKDGLYISAKIDKQNKNKVFTKVFYSDYQKELDRNLSKFENTLQTNRNVIVHGVCNALSNVLGWLNKDCAFTLIDNDTKKHGQKYFSKTVKSITDLYSEGHYTILVIPTAFFEEIKADYIRRCIRGKIESLIT